MEEKKYWLCPFVIDKETAIKALWTERDYAPQGGNKKGRRSINTNVGDIFNNRTYQWSKKMGQY